MGTGRGSLKTLKGDLQVTRSKNIISEAVEEGHCLIQQESAYSNGD
jgi:hypothetical protein